jgi:hypothetical protein
MSLDCPYETNDTEFSPYDTKNDTSDVIETKPSEIFNEASIYESKDLTDLQSEVSLVGLKYDNYTYLSDEKKVRLTINKRCFNYQLIFLINFKK